MERRRKQKVAKEGYIAKRASIVSTAGGVGWSIRTAESAASLAS